MGRIQVFLSLLSNIIGSIVVPDNAGDAQRVLMVVFQKMGWKVTPEYWVRDRGDGHNGYIDLVLLADGLKVGIEIDNVNPREKSIYKLVENDFDVRIILLRNGAALPFRTPDGIDLVYSLSTG